MNIRRPSGPRFVASPFVSIHRDVFLLLALVPPLAAVWGRMLSPATQIGCRSAQPANERSPQLLHHSEVMWSGGGLKRSLISAHTVTLATTHCSTGPNWSPLSNSHPLMCFDAFISFLWPRKSRGGKETCTGPTGDAAKVQDNRTVTKRSVGSNTGLPCEADTPSPR